MADTLHLVDGSGYVYRAFYAIRPLSTRAGVPTNAVIGFAKMINKLLADERPTHVGMTFDPKGKTFRHARYPRYKETRQSMPEDLAPQFALVREFCARMGLPILEVEGFEADDVIATLAREAVDAGHRVAIVSADKDLMQLVGGAVSMFDPMNDKRYDPAAVEEKWGVPPPRVPDLLALTGDTSDNIPGVPKIGKKTAAQLIRAHGDLEQVIRAVQAQAAPKAAERSLLEHVAEARLSKELVVLDDHVPIALDLEALRFTPARSERVSPFFREIEAFALIREFGFEDGTTTSAPDSEATSGPASATAAPELASPNAEVPPVSVAVALDRGAYVSLLQETELADYLQRATAAGRLAIDLLATHDDPMRAQITGVALAAPGQPAAYVPLTHRYLGAPKQIPQARLLELLRPALEDAALGKVGHQLKFVRRALARLGVAMRGLRDDVSIAAYCLDPGRASFTVAALARELLGHEAMQERDLLGIGKKQLRFDEVSVDEAKPHAAERADIALRIADVAGPQLQSDPLRTLYRDLEMPLLEVLADMEDAGIKVDRAALRVLSDEFTERLKTVEHQAHAAAGEVFNLGSPKQLGELFFERLGYPVQRRTKTGYSTDHEVLEELAQTYPLPGIVLQHRQIHKLKSTYVDALLKLADPSTSRVHTTYNQAGAATGRLSSNDPNLQNIPIRTEEGRRIRSVFVAEPGHVLISADYSQIELRILAHLSGDPRFVEAFRNGEDIHRRTAMEVLTNGEEPPAEARRRSKAINFGIIYGLSAFGLSRQLGIPTHESSEMIKRYFAHYPVVRSYLDHTVAEARDRGYVSTLLGRRRFLPDLRSKNRTMRSAAERVAMNTPMQGTAADLIKLAMIRVARGLRERRLSARLLLQVHDELVLESPVAEQREVEALVREEMSHVKELNVPLVVDVGSAASWADAH